MRIAFSVLLVAAGISIGFLLGLTARSSSAPPPPAPIPAVKQQHQQASDVEPEPVSGQPVVGAWSVHAYANELLRGQLDLDAVLFAPNSKLCLQRSAHGSVSFKTCETNQIDQMWVWSPRGQEGVLRGDGQCLGFTVAGASPDMLPCSASQSLWKFTEDGMFFNSATRLCLSVASDGNAAASPCANVAVQKLRLLATAYLLESDGIASASPVDQVQNPSKPSAVSVQEVVPAASSSSVVPGLEVEPRDKQTIGTKMVLWQRGWCLDRFSRDSIVAYGCQLGSTNQMWEWNADGQLQGSNACLTVKGTAVVLDNCAKDASREWQYTKDGHFRFKATGLCLQVSKKEMDKIFAAECSEDPNQMFDVMDSSVLAKEDGTSKEPKGRKVTLWHQGWCLDRFSAHRIVGYGCQKGSDNQAFYWTDNGQIQITTTKCLLPTRTGGLIVMRCPSGNVWKYTENYQLLHVQSRLCLESNAAQMQPATMAPCDDTKVRQRWLLNDVNPKPFKPDFENDPEAKTGHAIWNSDSVPKQLDLALKRLQEVAADVDSEKRWPVGHRRAAVLFQHSGTTDQLRWWIKAWHAVGLDTANAAFDVFVAVEQNIVPFLPSECKEAPNPPESFPMEGKIPGRCVFVVMDPINRRDPVYGKYGYMNSMECVYNRFTIPYLKRYKLLMRTDLDTFPAPRLVEWWPEETIMANGHAYAYGTVPRQLAEAAKEAGIRHYGKTGLASTWYGPAQEVIQMSRITVAAGRFILYRFFGHSPCRQPEDRRPEGKCDAIENQGEWSKTIYEGVALLYAQEFGANHVWGDHGKPVRYGVVDHGTESGASVCTPYHLHVHHNADVFSKLAYVVDKYNDMNLDELDLRSIRGFAAYLALTANGKGIGGDQALQKIGGSFHFEDLCRQ